MSGTDHKVFCNNHVLHNGAGDGAYATFDNTQVVLTPGNTTVATFNTTTVTLTGSSAINLQSTQILAGDGASAPRIQGQVGLRVSAGNGGVGAEIDMNTGGNTAIISSGTNVAIFNTSTVTFNVPVTFPVYTAAAKPASGQVGQQIAISDSAGGGHPNGMMAFWDTTNARWSYIHDNSAV